MGELRNSYKILDEELKGNKSLNSITVEGVIRVHAQHTTNHSSS
jgi:hypothetical protein